MDSNIVQEGESDVLRVATKMVPPEMIGSIELETILENMKRSLATQLDGVAIAAPQIAEPWQIFVVSGKVYDQLKQTDSNKVETIEIPEEKSHPDKVFINPEITRASKEILELDEGCLSVRNYYGKVPRHSKVTVKALDGSGKPFTEGRSGLLAQIFQHEIDHLYGVLFIDKAKDVEYRDLEDENDSTSQI